MGNSNWLLSAAIVPIEDRHSPMVSSRDRTCFAAQAHLAHQTTRQFGSSAVRENTKETTGASELEGTCDLEPYMT